MSESNNDISSLTRELKCDYVRPSFYIGYGYIEDDLVGNEQMVSLEEEVGNGSHILYDNMVTEDIFSNEGLDSM